jgi:hypothetical protein
MLELRALLTRIRVGMLRPMAPHRALIALRSSPQKMHTMTVQPFSEDEASHYH